MIIAEELDAQGMIIASGPIQADNIELEKVGSIIARILGDATNTRVAKPTIRTVGDNHRVQVRVDDVSSQYVKSWSSDVAHQVALDLEAEDIQWSCNIVADITLIPHQRSRATY